MVFQTKSKYFVLRVNQVSEWKSKGLSNQSVNLPGTLGDIVLSKTIRPSYIVFNNGALLYQNKNDATIGGPIVSIYIVYRTSLKTISSSNALKNSLFGAIKITNTSSLDREKYQYSGYGIGFDRKGTFTHPEGGDGKNIVVFGADLSNSKHANNKTKNILVLGQDFIQKKDDTTIYAEKMYSPNFTVENETFCLSLHYNGDDSYLFVNGKEVTKFKAKNSEIKVHPLCLGNISDEYPTSNDFTETALYGNVYDFSIDYGVAISVNDILHIHKYLMGKNGIV